MSRDAQATTNGLTVAEAPPSRRGFLKRAAAGAFGAAVAAPMLAADNASAAGSTPAYTDAGNTFTGDQRIDGRLGIGTAPSYPLHVRRVNDPGWAMKIESDWNALVLGHTKDLSA
jgi:hypothetical protein